LKIVALATPRHANPSNVFRFQYFGSANHPPAGDQTLLVSKPPAGMPVMIFCLLAYDLFKLYQALEV
jgi:hypothetical protein